MTISMHIFNIYQGFCFFNISQIWGKGNWMWWVVLFTVHQYLSDIWHCVFQTRHLLATVIHGGTDVNLWWSQCDHLWCNGFAWRGEILTDVGVLGYFWHICHWLIPDSYHTNMQEMSTGVNVLVSCWHESVVHWLIPAGTLSPILAMICLLVKLMQQQKCRRTKLVDVTIFKKVELTWRRRWGTWRWAEIAQGHPGGRPKKNKCPADRTSQLLKQILNRWKKLWWLTIPNTASGIRSRGERRYSSHMATRTATLQKNLPQLVWRPNSHLPYVGQRSRVKWMSGGWRSRKGVLWRVLGDLTKVSKS